HLRRLFVVRTSSADLVTLSLHDALPISVNGGPFSPAGVGSGVAFASVHGAPIVTQAVRSSIWACLSLVLGGICTISPWLTAPIRSEEHTSELQSRRDLVCRLLLEKKKRE